MHRTVESCEVAFFVTRGDLIAASGPIGDYLFASAFAASNPTLRSRVIRFNDPSTVFTLEPGLMLIGQNDEPPVNLLDVTTFVYFPVSFEPENIALRPVSEEDPKGSYDHRQWRVVTGYLESTLPQIGRCINPPDKARLAANKLVQIDAATAAGVAMAPSVVTNDESLMVSSVATHARAVRKNLSEGDARAQLCIPGHLDEESVAASPSLVQPFIDAEHELRIYAIGNEFITVKIRNGRQHSPGDDVRLEAVDPGDYSISQDYAASYPRLRAYLDALGLPYAAFDCLPDDGEILVLEVNPNGTWQSLPEPISSTITAAFHDYVAGLTDL